MHFMSRVFSNTTSLMTSVCMLYVGAMAASSYLSKYADKLLKGENQSIHLIKRPIKHVEAITFTSTCCQFIVVVVAIHCVI